MGFQCIMRAGRWGWGEEITAARAANCCWLVLGTLLPHEGGQSSQRKATRQREDACSAPCSAPLSPSRPGSSLIRLPCHALGADPPSPSGAPGSLSRSCLGTTGPHRLPCHALDAVDGLWQGGGRHPGEAEAEEAGLLGVAVLAGGEDDLGLAAHALPEGQLRLPGRLEQPAPAACRM